MTGAIFISDDLVLLCESIISTKACCKKED